MKRSSGPIVALAFAVVAATIALPATLDAQGAGPRRDGNWEVTVQMDMPGMPQGMPPTKMTQCLTKADVEDPTKAVPSAPGRGGMPNDCKVTDYKTVGNTVSWSMACTGANPLTGTTEFTYTGDTYVGTMKMNMEGGGQPMAMTMKYSGKRLGDCTK
jgi:hypothetical protein